MAVDNDASGRFRIVRAETPFAPLWGAQGTNGLVYLSAKVPDRAAFEAELKSRFGASSTWEWAGTAAQEAFQGDVDRLLDGEPAHLAIDLERHSPFQRRVADAVQRIPFGETRTYAEIARSLGKPKAARSVGGALARLPFPLYVPAHRVVRSTGLPAGCTLISPQMREALLAREKTHDD